MIHRDIHGFYSVEIQRKYEIFKDTLPQYHNSNGDFQDDLPLRAEAEPVVDPPTEEMEKLLADFVTEAVREVGWVPREVYRFLARPGPISMYSK